MFKTLEEAMDYLDSIDMLGESWDYLQSEPSWKIIQAANNMHYESNNLGLV